MSKLEEKRLNLLSDVDLEACAGISTKAWREAKGAHAKLKRVTIDRETGEPALYRLDVRTKQKILLDFWLNISQDPIIQRKTVEWIMANIGDYTKIMASQTPKEISVSGEILHGVMLVPTREKDMTAWLQRQEEQTEEARPFVLDDVNWKTEPDEPVEDDND